MAQAVLCQRCFFSEQVEKMAETGVIVRSDQEQEVQYAVQYVLILPLNFILLKDDMFASLSDTGHSSFHEGSE